MNFYLDILSILALTVFLFFIIKNQENGLIFGLLIKSLIDTSWDITLGGVSIIEVFSVIFLFYAYVFIKRHSLFSIIPKFLVFLWYLAHLGIAISLILDPVNGLKSLLKMLYFPVSLVLLPYFLLFSVQVQSEKTLKYLIYGALFSSLISIFQLVGVIPYEFEHTSKGLQRANGFYHDMVTSRMYVMQGLLVLAYIQLSGRYILRSWITWILLFIFVIAGYSLFSKALIGIFAVGLVLLILTTRQKLIHYLIGGFLLFSYVISNPTVIESTAQLFTKELEYQEGDLQNEGQLFSGRGMLWEDFIGQYSDGNPLEQFFGFGVNSGRTHNEFLRILILSGALGVIAYSLLILIFIAYSAKIFFSRDSLAFVAVFSFSIMIIDAISVVWGLYPFYMVVVIGLFTTVNLTRKYFPIDATTYPKTRIW